ncbi:hypothetical protein [Paraflavitalea speifideaquila]|uniref:hypothetical protein n=1 Tax=Paraflavitalea speifideaquila TaxID=3076558 RepID=UPI0028ECE82F|nr:hypothetical protein [Paraflavitalea speifideiaquila]
MIARNLPRDGGENSNLMLKNNAQRYYYQGQAPPQNIFNPFAWGEFIKAWKRGILRITRERIQKTAYRRQNEYSGLGFRS